MTCFLPRLATCVLGFGLCFGAMATSTTQPCASAASSAPASLEAEARLAFRERRFPAAYGRYMRLADSGHVEAAELALLMYRQGPSLFGHQWSASNPQLACWQALIIDGLRNNPLAPIDGDAIRTAKR